MKYFIMRINKNYTIEYKKNKCVDGWSKSKAECWAFSKQGANNIIEDIKSQDKYSSYVYSIVPSNGEGKNE